MRDSAPVDPGQTVTVEGHTGDVIGYDDVDDVVAIQWRTSRDGERVSLVPAEEVDA